MKRAWIILIITLAAALTSSAGTRVIPVAGHLPGANGTSWTTDVSLTNNDAVTRSVELVFHPENDASQTRVVTLAANGSVLLTDAVRPDDFPGVNPTSWVGQLEIRSAGNISASARTFTTAFAGGTYGSSYESFDPAVLSSEGAMTGLVQSTRFRSNIAWANAGDHPVVVSYALRRENGALLATSQLAVGAHTTVQTSLARDTVTTVDNARLLVEWTATKPIYAIASVIDNKSNDPTNIPSTSSATELFFPVVGRNAGAQSTFWSTSAAVSSRADVAGTVTFAYRDNASGQLFTTTAPLPAHGTVKAEDVNALVGAGEGSGSLTITSTVRVVSAVRVFNTLSDGATYGSALLAQANAVRASRVRIQGVRRDSAYRLNVSIFGHAEATDGTVRLFDDRGQEVESEPFHLGADVMGQIAMSRGEAEVRSGEIEVETHNGASITAVASNVDNRTGDTSLREAEQENERQHELEIRITPRTATVGAPVTFTIGDASGIASVAWTFGDGSTGSGATTTHTYASAGEFDVSATVTLASGAIVRDREDVHVVANAGGGGTTTNGSIDFSWTPLAPAVGQEVTFTASRTSNGGSFQWKFPGNVRKSGAVASFVFGSAGAFEVELELEHEGNGTVQANHVVSVGGGTPSTPSNPTPGNSTIDFTWSPANPAAGQTVTFTATGGNGGTFRFEFPGNVRKSGNVVTFAFASAGSFEVELEQEKEGSTTLHARHVVNVGGGAGGGNPGGGTVPTSVDFSWSPNTPRAGQTVTFTATSDVAPSSNSSYKWRFPDDSRPRGTTATYKFPAAGTYRVRVEIERPGQTSIERERTVTIAP
ncbi:MAG: PKD domain-containing protein [Acidobacteria bacterium]|nr:PKD domain-containing protein [Acidobacteriota bacterium]